MDPLVLLAIIPYLCATSNRTLVPLCCPCLRIRDATAHIIKIPVLRQSAVMGLKLLRAAMY